MKRNYTKRILSLSLSAIISISLLLMGFAAGSDITPVLADNIVIVLDPGHDNMHGGSSANGYSETVVNYKIALACKEALEEYNNVTVYLTTNNMQCPYPDNDSRYCNRHRTYKAAELGADLYVSLHNNSGGASGYQIIYPNDNYRPEIATVGYDVALSIAPYLDELGIPRHSLYSRDSTDDEQLDENFYPDGSRADYYNVIRNSKYKGVPAIIVEHTFLDNDYDNRFISSDSAIKALGEADANGIADYFGLSGASPTKPSYSPSEVNPTTEAATEAADNESGTESETESEAATEAETGSSAAPATGSNSSPSAEFFINASASGVTVFRHPAVWQRLHAQWYRLGFRGCFYKNPYTHVNIIVRRK